MRRDATRSHRATPLKAALAAALPAALLSTSAPAATTSTTFTVSATVDNNCTVSATNLDFGSYNTLLNITPTDATNAITVTCTLGTAYNIGLDAGTGSGATVTARKLSSGGNTLNYSLYQDALRTTVWGSTVGTNTVAGTGTGLAVAHNVYGRIPASQNVGSGTYTDTITVTITY